jgi:16S rRNA (cytidine1402-2'-O)-methyltransferase
VPAPLDFGCDSQAALPTRCPWPRCQVAARLGHWICENAKSTRAYLKRVGRAGAAGAAPAGAEPQELPRDVHKKGDLARGPFDARPLLTRPSGHDMGLVSEAGMPAVADPGSSVVRAAHDLGIEVVPLVGPVSLLLALAASGLNGQNFAFVGYLPQDAARAQPPHARTGILALKSGQTQLFIETPYRNAACGRPCCRPCSTTPGWQSAAA